MKLNYFYQIITNDEDEPVKRVYSPIEIPINQIHNYIKIKGVQATATDIVVVEPMTEQEAKENIPDIYDDIDPTIKVKSKIDKIKVGKKIKWKKIN